MQETPRSNRLHIGFYGRRNAGKSSLINLVTAQHTAIVSEYPGTTADPVIKSMELLPLGPVAVIDTAGLDDVGDLGGLRAARSREMMDRTDLAVLVVSAASAGDLTLEREWAGELKGRKTAVVGVLNKIDALRADEIEPLRERLAGEFGMAFAAVSALDPKCRGALLEIIVENAPAAFEAPTLVGDLFEPRAMVALVAPQDIQAPKGRLILPQVQVMRDVLDNGGLVTLAAAENYGRLLEALKEKPALVITDSQVFAAVERQTPPDVPLTSFSIVMARAKGDLRTFIRGARAIAGLTEGDKVLVAEACTHAPLEEDIGREKLPRWLRQKVGAGLTVDVATGLDFPPNLKEYALILHCGGCMFTRKQLMSRLIKAEAENVPITNYGVAIAQLNGILDRVTSVFPESRRAEW